MDFENGILLKTTFSNLAVSLSRITDPSWEQIQVLCHFMTHLPTANSPTTPTNFQDMKTPNFTPLVTDELLLSFEIISLFLTQSNSKFSDQLFQSLLSILQLAPVSQFSNSQHSSIAFFFRQSVARIRWIVEECRNLSFGPIDFVETVSKITSQLYDKLLSNRDEDVTMTTIAMLIGMYEGISVPKDQIRKEIENAGVEMLLESNNQKFQWTTRVTKEEIQQFVDISLSIVEFCSANVSSFSLLLFVPVCVG